MLKKIIGKLERKKIMTWILMWLNWSVATINAMLQLLDISKVIYIFSLSVGKKCYIRNNTP